jgi:hypothetical protein
MRRVVAIGEVLSGLFVRFVRRIAPRKGEFLLLSSGIHLVF